MYRFKYVLSKLSTNLNSTQMENKYQFHTDLDTFTFSHLFFKPSIVLQKSCMKFLDEPLARSKSTEINRPINRNHRIWTGVIQSHDWIHMERIILLLHAKNMFIPPTQKSCTPHSRPAWYVTGHKITKENQLYKNNWHWMHEIKINQNWNLFFL